MFKHIPTQLESTRLMIHRLKEIDLKDVYALHKTEVVNQYLPYTTWTSYQDAQDWFERVQLRRSQGDAEQFAIKLKTDQTFIGSCIVFGFDPEVASAEFGYVLHPDHWGHGYMLEAMQMFISTLQERLNLRVLKASVEEPNVASSGLLKKLEFALTDTSVEESGVRLQHWVKVF